MIIALWNYKITVPSLLRIAGYRIENGKYVRNDFPHGRFHAIIIDKKIMSFHYDIFIDGKPAHYAPRMPIKETKEFKRIGHKIFHLRFRDLREREIEDIKFYSKM